MIDTHCHLTYDPLMTQIEDVMRRAAEAGVDRMITVGTSPQDAALAADLAAQRPQVFATAGLHPNYSDQWPDTAALTAALREAIARPKVVALGEMGLDRHHADPPIDVQRRAFDVQLNLMRETRLPGIIHNREATADTLAVLRDAGIVPSRFVFHCFTGSDAELDAILEFGAWVSFTGVVTFKNSATLLASSARVPIDRVMIETDAPYLTPAPHRKVKVNEPGYVVFTARAMAAQRNMGETDFVSAVDANAQRFFGLP
ncbi:MAG: TatD family hydrolase [Planctomycetes bacterium]|nr:TatD family hydrolase [Planctomycetota bacterium]